MTAPRSSHFMVYGFSTFLICTLLLTFFTSCLKPKVDTPDQQSLVSVINGTIGLSGLTYSINGVRVQGTLNYTDESKYFVTFPGARKFDFAVDGQAGTLISATFDLKQNTYHSIFVSGDGGTMNTLFTTDDLTSPAAGKAKLRFINLTSDAGQLALGVKSAANLFPELSYNSTSAFIQIDPGVYELQLKTPSGTLLKQLNVTLSSGKIYSVWSKGLISGTSNSPVGLQFSTLN